jgi:UDP-N-acetylmuramoylalanine--D-glutamate ligase
MTATDHSLAPRGTLLESLQGARVHIVGASGAEGTALLLHLAGELGIQGIVAHDFAPDMRSFALSFRRANTAWDRKRREETLARLRRLPVQFRLGDDYLSGVEHADVVLASQNWFNYPANSPGIPRAVERGARLLGLADLALDLFEGARIGVTGSNGKSTTTALLNHMLQHGTGQERRVLQGGNDRDRQVSLAQVEQGLRSDLLLWEVSNRHLRDRSVPLDVAVITNITRNHIEDHGSWEAYVAAKKRIAEGVAPGGHLVLSSVDPVLRRQTQDLRRSRATLWRFGQPPLPGFSPDGLAWIDEMGVVCLRRPGEIQVHEVGSAGEMPLPGAHNRANLLAAVCAAVAAGASPERLGPTFATFPALPGRLEVVADRDGVRWIYDIQATTAPAAAAGIHAIGGGGRRIVLIVGGEDKGMDFGGMAEAARQHCDRLIALPGSGTDALLEAVGQHLPVDRCEDLDAAVALARQLAEPGSAVLLSPGCAFFHRRFILSGPTFAKRVEAALGEHS